MKSKHTARILLIEDSEDDAELTQRALRRSKLDIEIIWLRDGEEGMQYLFNEIVKDNNPSSLKPELILLDLKMPKISGIEVLERLKTEPQTQEIPVVMMTSSKEDKDLQTCYKLGANSYVVKPINFNDFMEVAQNISEYWLHINESSNRLKSKK